MDSKIKEYLLEDGAGIGPCMDAKAHNGYVYAIQKKNDVHNGRLCVVSAEQELVAFYDGIGSTRQLEILGDTAFVTAREDGLWIFDISACEPKLICHYQSVEFATGLALCGNLAFISCRQFGVEIIDISDLTHPKQVSIIRVGEVQSATVHENILYCGVWGSMEVVVVDIADPTKPQVLNKIPLQGRGDGVCVRDNILYAATGQHARGIVNVVNKEDPAFGCGNGLECFDITNPAAPVKCGGVRFEKAHCLFVDMWEPGLYGDTLVVNDSILGVYGMDATTLEQKFRVRVQEGDAVTGATVLNGDLYVATAYGDLYVVRGLELAPQAPNAADVTFSYIPQALSCTGEGAALETVYRADYPVFAISEGTQLLALACVEGGVHVLDKETLSLCYVIPTKSGARDVALYGDVLYVAEDAAGVEIFRLTKQNYEKIGGFADAMNINQLALSESGSYLMCAITTHTLKMYDVRNPAQVRELYAYKVPVGVLYGNNFASGKLADGTMIAFCHHEGMLTTNPENGDTAFHLTEYKRKIGVCGYCGSHGIETDGTNIFYTSTGGYSLLSTTDESPCLLESKISYTASDKFRGLLTLHGDKMIACDRANGIVSALDISDIENPVLLAKLSINASPSKALWTDAGIYIPGGHAGVLKLNF